MSAPDLASWIVKRPRPTARLRLVCFPCSGCGATSFRGWAEGMPHVEVCAVRAPGRETRLREPAFTRMEPLVGAVVEALRGELDRPFAFFGHSLGSFVAFETARALRRAGLPAPRHLLLAGCPSPEAHPVKRPIHDLADAELVLALRRYGGTPDEVMKNDELMSLILPILRADLTVHETYATTPEAPLDLPITALGGLEDDHATRADLEGWRAHTTRAFLLRMFPGGHFFVNTQRTPLLGAVLQDLDPHLR